MSAACKTQLWGGGGDGVEPSNRPRSLDNVHGQGPSDCDSGPDLATVRARPKLDNSKKDRWRCFNYTEKVDCTARREEC